MKSIYYPSYYDNFSCIADKCPDSCCTKWEIVIDDDTIKKYSSLDSSFGEKIRDSIEESDEGEKYFRLTDDRCPFLNECGLCDIHLNLGEDFTSTVCRQHPRFIEEFDGFTEISLSLSCPEAMRLIFSEKSCDNIYPVPFYNGEDEVLSLLISSREKILKHPDDFFLLKSVLLDTAADDILDIDCVYVQEHPEITVGFIKDFIDVLLERCEILTSEWETYLKYSYSSEILIEEIECFIKNNKDNVCKAIKYFIYRYYLKAVNDLDVYSRGLFILMAVIVSSYIALSNKISFEEAVRLFSKEIEHSTDNVDIILDFLRDI